MYHGGDFWERGLAGPRPRSTGYYGRIRIRPNGKEMTLQKELTGRTCRRIPLQVALLLSILGSWAVPANVIAADCDGDDLDDVMAITAGGVADCNNNLVPDACEGIPIRTRSRPNDHLGGFDTPSLRQYRPRRRR